MSASEERGTTGEKCQTTGVYYCVRHTTQEIAIAKGDTFPPCREGGGNHGTTWILRRKS